MDDKIDFVRKREQLESNSVQYHKDKVETQLDTESLGYINIKCTSCKLASYCPYRNLADPGCQMRKQIYDNIFAKILFKTDNPIMLNRLRLVSRYYTELMLMRSFGLKPDGEEIMLLKTTLAEFDKLHIDSSGELFDVNSKETVPWEMDPEVVEMKKKVERNAQLEAELLILKSELERFKRAQPKEGEHV